MITTTFITTISSNFDTQSMADMNTLTESVTSGSTDTISTGTDEMMITITPIVNTQGKVFNFLITLEPMIFVFVLFIISFSFLTE